MTKNLGSGWACFLENGWGRVDWEGEGKELLKLCPTSAIIISLILCQGKDENSCIRKQDKTKCFLIQKNNTFSFLKKSTLNKQCWLGI